MTRVRGSRGFRDPLSLKHLDRDVALHASHITSKKSPISSNIWTARPPVSAADRLKEWAYSTKLDHMPSYPNRSPLSANHGITVAVKDNIITTHLPSSCASNVLRGYVAPRKATVIEIMEQVGMAVIGKTNMDEFGMGSHTTNSAFGPLRQPRCPLSVGGSSGGSALAVAAGQCHVGLGTDTGGSVRLPAAYLGLFGFKPSYGMISRYGVVPYANSLDTVGLLARKPLDIWLLYNTLSEPDARDPTCLSHSTRKRVEAVRIARTVAARSDPLRAVLTYDRIPKSLELVDSPHLAKNRAFTTKSLPQAIGIRRIGIPTDYNIAELQPEVRRAWRNTIALLRQLGHDIVTIELPTTRHALSAYYILAPAEASSNLAKYDGIRYGPVRSEQSAQADNGVLYSAHRGSLFGSEVQRRILLGAFSLSAGAMDNYFLQAQRVRRLVQNDFNGVFRMPHPLLEGAQGVSNGVDFILCPTAPTTPPDVKDKLNDSSPVEAYMNDVFTVPASLAGLPAYSFPPPPPPGGVVGDFSRSVGMQIIGQYGDDLEVMQFVMGKIWKRTEWNKQEPVSMPRDGPSFR